MKKIVSLVFVCITVLFLVPSCAELQDPTGNTVKYEILDDGTAMITSVSTGYMDLRLPSEINGRMVTVIKESAFYNDQHLRTVFIPNTVSRIETDAFADLPYLNKVIFEKGGKCIIEDQAFEGCFRLKTLDFNGSVYEIGDSAFKNCKRIRRIKVGEELVSIGTDAFMGCEQLLFKAEKGSYADEYAQSHFLTTRFVETSQFLWGFLLMVSLIVVLVLIVISKKKKMKKSKNVK